MWVQNLAQFSNKSLRYWSNFLINGRTMQTSSSLRLALKIYKLKLFLISGKSENSIQKEQSQIKLEKSNMTCIFLLLLFVFSFLFWKLISVIYWSRIKQFVFCYFEQCLGFLGGVFLHRMYATLLETYQLSGTMTTNTLAMTMKGENSSNQCKAMLWMSFWKRQIIQTSGRTC